MHILIDHVIIYEVLSINRPFLSNSLEVVSLKDSCKVYCCFPSALSEQPLQRKVSKSAIVPTCKMDYWTF